MTGPDTRRLVAVICQLPVPFEDVVPVLRDEGAAVVADYVTAEGTLVVTLRPGPSAPLHWDVEVHLGPLVEDDDDVGVPLWWEAASLPALFPTLNAGLEATPNQTGTDLRLVGHYLLPLGRIGAYGDGLRGHRLARACLEDFLTRVSARIINRVLQREGSPEVR